MASTVTTDRLHPETSFYEYQGRYRGIFAWILSTDHKRIGLLYLSLILFFFSCSRLLWISNAAQTDCPRIQPDETSDV